MSRLALVGVGVAAILAAPVLTNVHFSVPFVQYIGTAGDRAPAAKAATAPTPRVALSTPVDEGRGDRLARKDDRYLPAARSTGKTDRLTPHDASLDAHRMALLPSSMTPARVTRSARFMLAPDRAAPMARGTADAVSVARMQEFAQSPTESGGAKAERLAALLQGTAGNAEAATASAAVPHPTRRPEHRIATAAETTGSSQPSGVAELIGSLPSDKPETDPVQVASLENDMTPDAALAEATPPQGVLLPDTAPRQSLRPTMRAPAPTTPEPAARESAPEDTARAKPAAPANPSTPVRQPSRGGTTLAYAPANGATESGGNSGGGLLGRIFGGGAKHSGLPGAGERIAVYDISAATVYMPNGEKLEAHSGLGHMQDNPRFTDAKNKGPTPENVYNLQMRRNLFHGVEAVRLLPADGKKKYNRDGLLAHTYMYRGGMSQSNGCVVFKNYPRFLTAFKKGRVTRMIVVPRLAELPTYMASL